MIVQMVSATDLHAALEYSIDFSDPTNNWGWQEKLEEAFCRGLADSMLDNEQTHPICISVFDPHGWTMGNGHHRMAVAMAAMTDIMVLFAEDNDWGHYAETSEDND